MKRTNIKDRMIFNDLISEELPPGYYRGTDKKLGVIMNGEQYLLKFPNPVKIGGLLTFCAYNPVSEYLSCKIYESAGFPAQEVTLGEYITKSGNVKTACACKDVRAPGETLSEARYLDQAEMGAAIRRQPVTLKAIKDMISRNPYVDPEDMAARYYEMFIIDALIGNAARHNDDWGILVSGNGHARLAPVYDCGASMSPLLQDDKFTPDVMRDQALNLYSAVMDDGFKKISFREYLLSGNDPDLNEALKRVMPRIDVARIDDIINEAPYISDTRKEFYHRLIKIRYDEILMPALENALKR